MLVFASPTRGSHFHTFFAPAFQANKRFLPHWCGIFSWDVTKGAEKQPWIVISKTHDENSLRRTKSSALTRYLYDAVHSERICLERPQTQGSSSIWCVISHNSKTANGSRWIVILEVLLFRKTVLTFFTSGLTSSPANLMKCVDGWNISLDSSGFCIVSACAVFLACAESYQSLTSPSMFRCGIRNDVMWRR